MIVTKIVSIFTRLNIALAMLSSVSAMSKWQAQNVQRKHQSPALFQRAPVSELLDCLYCLFDLPRFYNQYNIEPDY